MRRKIRWQGGVGLLIVAVACAGPVLAQVGSGDTGRTRPGAREYFVLNIITDDAVAVGIFRDDDACDRECAPVFSLDALRLLVIDPPLGGRVAKVELVCADTVCSPTERDIVSIGFGGDVGVDFDVSGGYAGVALAKVGIGLSPGFGVGLEWGLTGPLRITDPEDFQTFRVGGNVLTDSGIGRMVFSHSLIVGLRRRAGITGVVSFVGEKNPSAKLFVASLSRQGDFKCHDESAEAGENDGSCPADIADRLRQYCDEQCGVFAETGELAGGPATRLDREELEEALELAKDGIDLLRSTIRERLIASRLADARELLQQLRDGDDLKEELKAELADGLSTAIEEVLDIVTSNTRFGDFSGDFKNLKNLKNLNQNLTTMRNNIHGRLGKLRENQNSICGKVVGCKLAFPKF